MWRPAHAPPCLPVVPIFGAASETGLPRWLLTGCLWPEAMAQLCTRARIRAGGEADHEPLLCLDWKRNSSFTQGLFTEASLPQIVGIVPVGIVQTKSSHGFTGLPDRHRSSQEFVCAHNERFWVFSSILMTAENNKNMFLMLWSQLSGQGDTVTAALKCFLVVGSAPTQLQRPRLILLAL